VAAALIAAGNVSKNFIHPAAAMQMESIAGNKT
jgi:hypothetical protein